METTAAVAQEIGLVGRILRVFYSPAETFEAVQRRHSRLDWFVPTLLVVVVAMGSTWATLPLMQRTQAQVASQMAAKQHMTPEQSAQQQAAMEKMAGVTQVVSVVSIVVGTFVMLFIMGGILLMVGRLALGGDGLTYGQALALHAYASLVSIPQNVVLTPIRQARESMMVSLGPGLFLDEATLQTYVGRFLGSLDIFMLWQVVVAAIGLAVLSRAAFGKALGVLGAITLLFLAGAAALRGLVPGM